MNDLRGSYNLIAKRAGCSRKYVGMVLENKLGKYYKRGTPLVIQIRELAARLEDMFQSE